MANESNWSHMMRLHPKLALTLTSAEAAREQIRRSLPKGTGAELLYHLDDVVIQIEGALAALEAARVAEREMRNKPQT